MNSTSPALAATTAEAVVVAEDLVKRYGGRNVVDRVSLNVRRGECFGLLGPNGAGKTTTLRMLLGLTTPDAGRLEVLGLPIPERAREARRRVGIVPQFDNLDPDFTVEENLLTYASYFGMSGNEARSRIAGLIEFAALQGRENAPIATLSGGMKRRLTLARALINQPELVVLDEPTTGLDPQARHHIWQRLRRLIEQGSTLILTTHYMEEAERLCDRLAIIDQGRVIACDSPRAMIDAEVEPHVIEIQGAEAREWSARLGSASGVRQRSAGDSTLLYTADPKPLLEALGETRLRYLHRPADMEDVFLKLTGHDLRD
ncbi:MAG: ATP-binding cassette domain-containing protein [Ectothiorhodospiraceae bacterium]|jgi:lipooligosaccharide transport system ATP-binding protein|nr:ATP-binding cassette domain-containing protein [Ectothiorhodospiraceae bacterium]